MCARLSLPDAKPRVASSGHRNACTLHAVEALDQSARRSSLTTCLGEQQVLTRLRTELAAPRAQAAARQAARPATPVVGGEEQGGAAGAARMRLAAARALGRLGARLRPGARPRAPPSSCRDRRARACQARCVHCAARSRVRWARARCAAPHAPPRARARSRGPARGAAGGAGGRERHRPPARRPGGRGVGARCQGGRGRACPGGCGASRARRVCGARRAFVAA